MHLRGVCELLSAAQKWSFRQPHQRKKKKRTARVLFCRGIRQWRRYPHLPLTSKLDASSWGMRTPFCYAEMEFSSATSTKKEKENHKGSLLVEVFANGEDTRTCRLQASLMRLRGVCALLSAAQKWSFHQPHQRKKRKRTTRVLFCGGIRRWRRYPHLPLTSELDASSWGMRTPFCCAEMEFSSATSTKKEKENHKGSLSLFLVEVWRFELQASSTRNWRATNCATPRGDYQ